MRPNTVIDLARSWIGTPYVTGGAMKGVGCDCIGLIRGLLSELTGQPLVQTPAWRADWAMARGAPMIAAARRHLVPVDAPQPGDVVVFRMEFDRAAHCGVAMPQGRIIHATETSGVVEVSPAGWSDRVVFAASFPLACN